MKKSIFILMLLATIGLSKSIAQTTFTLLHVNDTHSHLDAFGPKDANLEGTIGGIAKAASIIGEVRATDPNVILLHAGDAFVGDAMFNTYFGVPELELMQQLGFDAMAVGNHELDFGPDVLYGSLSTAFGAVGSFPVLSANLDMTGFPALQSYIQPSIIINRAGVNIGIFGMTVPNSPTTNAAPCVLDTNLVSIAQQMATSLRANGAQVVICLSHLGVFYDQQVVENTTGIDFVIGGHDHYLFSEPMVFNNLNGTPISVFQAGEEYKYIGKLHFTVNNNGTVSINDYHIINVDKTIPFYQPVQDVVESLKPGVVELFGDLYHHSIARTFDTLNYRYDSTRSRFRDTPLGNLITDAFRKKTGTELAIDPIGLMRDDIFPGQIVGADVFRSLSLVGGYDTTLSPHFTGYNLATFNITGAQLLYGIEYCLANLQTGEDFFLQVSGFSFKYDMTKPAGQRVIQHSIRLDNCRRFSLNGTYSVTVNSGAAELLSLLGVTVTNLQFLPNYEWNVVQDYITRLRIADYYSTGRIIETHDDDDRITDENTSPSDFHFDNYPNPFDHSTTITFNLDQTQHVSLKVVDISGRTIAIIADNYFDKGQYNIPWNADDVNAGIYFLQLQTNGNSINKKFVITK